MNHNLTKKHLDFAAGEGRYGGFLAEKHPDIMVISLENFTKYGLREAREAIRKATVLPNHLYVQGYTEDNPSACCSWDPNYREEGSFYIPLKRKSFDSMSICFPGEGGYGIGKVAIKFLKEGGTFTLRLRNIFRSTKHMRNLFDLPIGSFELMRSRTLTEKDLSLHYISFRKKVKCFREYIFRLVR